MLLASMLGSPQGGSGVSSSALQRQIAHATCAYGFHCQFKDSSKVVPTKQCECGNRFHTQCLSLSFEDAETQVDSHVNMDQWNLDSCLLQHAGQNADEDSPAKRKREKQGAMNACWNVWCMRPLKFRSRTLKEAACFATATRCRPLPKSAAIWGQASTGIFSNTRTENFQSTRSSICSMMPCANLRIPAKNLQQTVEGVSLVGTILDILDIF